MALFGNDARPANAGADAEAEGSQGLCHRPGGTDFLETQFRMGVKIAPPTDQLSLEYAGLT